MISSVKSIIYRTIMTRTAVLSLVVLAAVVQCQLLYVANLYRHGARYPISKIELYDSKETAADSG